MQTVTGDAVALRNADGFTFSKPLLGTEGECRVYPQKCCWKAVLVKIHLKYLGEIWELAGRRRQLFADRVQIIHCSVQSLHHFCPEFLCDTAKRVFYISPFLDKSKHLPSVYRGKYEKGLGEDLYLFQYSEKQQQATHFFSFFSVNHQSQRRILTCSDPKHWAEDQTRWSQTCCRHEQAHNGEWSSSCSSSRQLAVMVAAL